MAKIKVVQFDPEKYPKPQEEIEVRAWGIGGNADQMFVIGSGANFNASGNIWVEIIYTVNGVQIFYTRNFIHMLGFPGHDYDPEVMLEKFVLGESDSYGFGDMLPETSIRLKREKFSYQVPDGEELSGSSCDLEISADVGVIFGMAAPGERFIKIVIKDIESEEGIQFMRDLTRELISAQNGKIPDPATLLEKSSEWSFTRETNKRAYDLISEHYRESYFQNPLLTPMFDEWLAGLPAGGRILDAGCGHGTPVISRLLERGFNVSGTDLSPVMLQRAREKFPDVNFSNKTISELENQEEFDGICSLSSLLYMDPIDLYHSVYRLHQALKPGGWLFLYAYDTHPDWRGLPIGERIDHWMWSWTYSMAEAVHALEQHGYFKVLKAEDVTTKSEKRKYLAEWRKERLQQYKDSIKNLFNAGPPPPPPDLTRKPKQFVNCYAIIARK